jgi:leucyl aminopeptidase
VDCKIAKGKIEDFKCDALIALVYQGESDMVGGPFRKLLQRAMDDGHFRGAACELFQIYPLDGTGASRLIIVGLGKRELSSPEIIRRAAGTGISSARKLRTAAFLPLDKPTETIVPLVDGVILGDYRFDQLKSVKDGSKLETVYFFTGNANIDEKYLNALRIINEGTCIARDLANMPANLLNPAALADDAVELGKQYGIPVKVLNEAQIEKLKMGALLGVAQGSVNRPKLVVWEYKGGKAGEKPIVLVGKGVTFDSGGISIKPTEGMEAMKGDMGGAGAVISLISVLGQIKPKINVVGITPLVENMPSGSSYRPGDVLTASNGKTIEIISTDAEGRLILADALVYAQKFDPKYIVDIATLTGACMVALGMNICAGIMGKDQPLIDNLIKSGTQSGERLWQLPLWDDYKELIKTPAADMKNSGGRWGGAISAAMLLAAFTEGYRWAHLDIAGTDREEGMNPYRYKGATGFGVRLLARFILNEAGTFKK